MKKLTLCILAAIPSLYAFGNQQDPLSCGVDASASKIPRARSLTTTAVDHSWSIGQKKVLDVRIGFPDLPSVSTVDQDTTGLILAANKFTRSSYGLTTLIPTVSTKTYILPHTVTYYTNQTLFAFNSAISTDANVLASKDYDLNSFDRIIYHFPHVAVRYGGYADIGGKRAWLNGQFGWRILVHELGHTYGCFHAHLWQSSTSDPTSTTGRYYDYGDRYDIMGNDWSSNDAIDWNEGYKYDLGWLPAASVKRLTQHGTYTVRIYRFDNASSSGIRAVVLPRPNNTSQHYWVAYRRSFSTNAILSNGAYVTWLWSSTMSSALIDYIPSTDYKDAAVPIGKSMTEGTLSIKPIGNGGTAPNEWLDVEITL